MKLRFSTLAFLATGLLGPALTVGCVDSRASRTGVFDENQYIRKDFLIRGTDDTDPGWIMKATVTNVSTPNPFSGGFNIFPGSESGGQLVRFRVSQDKLQIVNQREISTNSHPDGSDPDGTVLTVNPDGREEEVLNAWPITNVDIKYRVNLDGENTNFIEENQELDWKTRQFVKINFAKNDMSDVAAMGPYTALTLPKCVDEGNSSATLKTDSWIEDVNSNYMEWTVQVTAPIRWDDETCVQAFGDLGVIALNEGRQNVTFDVKYAFMRAKDAKTNTYQPLIVGEKDPIRHKYGWFDWIPITRDNDSGQLAAQQYVERFDPAKPIVWYFEEGFPENYKAFFTDPTNGLAVKTNAVLAQAGAAARVEFHNWEELPKYTIDGVDNLPETQQRPHFGDPRYSFIRWSSDKDAEDIFAGVTQFVTDPRNGETLSSSIVINDFALKDLYVQRIDEYLKEIGASDDINSVDANGNPTEWPTTPTGASANCKVGDTAPFSTPTAVANHNGTSSLFDKMQTYLNRPAQSNGHLSPMDFTVKQDDDFLQAYYALLPYEVFGDPDANPFVIREGGAGTLGPAEIWQRTQLDLQQRQIAGNIDKGLEPYEGYSGADGVKNATAFLNNWRSLTQNHYELEHIKQLQLKQMGRHLDSPDAFSFETIIAKDARQCIDTGSGPHWETKQEWIDSLTSTYWSQVLWHEFGHTLGLSHNFMASLDKNNFPGKYTYTWSEDHPDEQVPDATCTPPSTNPDGSDAPSVDPCTQGVCNDAGHCVECVQDSDCTPIAPNLPVKCDTSKNVCTSHIDHTDTRYGLYANSVMEYNAVPDRIFWQQGWGPYDQGAIGFIYGNNGTHDVVADNTASISGQTSATTPWNDSSGFDANGKEIQYLFCRDEQITYTPFCRQGDIGTTPSEIMANAIDQYEWQYKWRNFRLYRKYWDNADYAMAPANLVYEMRRFLSLWAFDWSDSELADTFRRIGVTNPDTNGSQLQYYDQLTQKFNTEVSAANQMVAAFHKAVIQQSAGERPYATIYDKYFGDVTQQGIILDKLFAMQGWVGLWPTTNYDQNQAGSYIASYSSFGDPTYQAVAYDTVDSMVGGQYDAYPYFVPLAVAQFAQDTHDPAFSGNPAVRDWIGGHVFYRLDDFLNFFRDIAVQNNQCADISTCAYDPRDPSISDDHNEFLGPDQRQWIWAYIADRNTWTAVEKERNTASYIIVKNYTDDVIHQKDDGAFPGGAYAYQLPMKYFLDSFNEFN